MVLGRHHSHPTIVRHLILFASPVLDLYLHSIIFITFPCSCPFSLSRTLFKVLSFDHISSSSSLWTWSIIRSHVISSLASCSHAPVVGEHPDGVLVAHGVAGGAGAQEGLVVVARQPATFLIQTNEMHIGEKSKKRGQKINQWPIKRLENYLASCWERGSVASSPAELLFLRCDQFWF